MKPDPHPLPTLLTSGDCGSPKSRRQGRYMILNLVHSCSAGKQIAKNWALPSLAVVQSNRNGQRPLKSQQRVQGEPLLQVALLSLS